MKRMILYGWLVIFFSILGGCGKDSEQPRNKVVEGKVSAINLETGVVKMLWYNTKKQQEIELEGKLAADAEILINGVVVPLDALRVDDRVKVIGRIEKRDDESSLIATQVHVTRPEIIDTTTTTKPATGE